MVQFVTPEVFLIAGTQVEEDGLNRLLAAMGAEEWETDAASDAEALSEVAGRLCYRSFKPGLNPNVTRVREGNLSYLGNVIRQGHGSVLEHPSVSFAFLGVSRVFTHELVRHRAGMAYSQESLRFVRLDALTAYYPELGFGVDTMLALYDSLPPELRQDISGVAETPEKKRLLWAQQKALQLREEFTRAFTEAEERQARFSAMLHLDACPSFDIKKLITSAMRRMAPDGLGTAIIATSNHRALRDIIQRRTDRHAEEEIRLVYVKVFEMVQERFPAFYQDGRATMVRGLPEVTFETSRV